MEFKPLRWLAHKAEKISRNFFYKVVFPLIYNNKPLEKKIDINSVKKILVLRTDYVGDMICTTPLFNVIKKMNPNVRLIVACSDSNFGVIQYDDNIDEKIILVRSKKLVKSMLRYLKKQDIEILIKPDKSKMTKLGIWLNKISPRGVKASFALEERPFYWKLYNHLEKVSPQPDMHMSHIYLELIKGIFSNPVNEDWIEQYIVLPDSARQKWRSFSDENNISRKNFIVVNLSVRQKHNRWSEEGYEYIISEFINKYNSCKVVLSAVGGDDISFAKRLESKYPSVYYYTTQDVLEAGAVCEDAILAVTPDTGFMHIASAVKCPVVGLFIWSQLNWHPFKVPSRNITTPDKLLSSVKKEEVLSAMESLLTELKKY